MNGLLVPSGPNTAASWLPHDHHNHVNPVDYLQHSRHSCLDLGLHEGEGVKIGDGIKTGREDTSIVYCRACGFVDEPYTGIGQRMSGCPTKGCSNNFGWLHYEAATEYPKVVEILKKIKEQAA